MENKKKKIDNQKHTGASVFMKILRPEVDKDIEQERECETEMERECETERRRERWREIERKK